MKDLSRTEVQPLIAALDDPSASVRLAALRALVRLTLSREAWIDISHSVASLLQAMPEGTSLENQTLRGIPYLEAIEAAVFVPTKTVRGLLYNLLDAEDPDLQSATAHALAKAGDSASLSRLIAELSASNAERRVEVAKSLSLLHALAMRNPVREVYQRETDGDVRFWLALTLAGLGETAEIEQILGELRRGDLDLRELY